MGNIECYPTSLIYKGKRRKINCGRRAVVLGLTRGLLSVVLRWPLLCATPRLRHLLQYLLAAYSLMNEIEILQLMKRH